MSLAGSAEALMSVVGMLVVMRGGGGGGRRAAGAAFLVFSSCLSLSHLHTNSPFLPISRGLFAIAIFLLLFSSSLHCVIPTCLPSAPSSPFSHPAVDHGGCAVESTAIRWVLHKKNGTFRKQGVVQRQERGGAARRRMHFRVSRYTEVVVSVQDRKGL